MEKVITANSFCGTSPSEIEKIDEYNGTITNCMNIKSLTLNSNLNLDSTLPVDEKQSLEEFYNKVVTVILEINRVQDMIHSNKIFGGCGVQLHNLMEHAYKPGIKFHLLKLL